MQTMPFKSTLLIVLSLLLLPLTVIGEQESGSGDQKYSGLWVGTYKSESGNSGTVSFNFNREAKGEWRGTVKYSNDNGEQTADLKSLLIADGKMNAKIENDSGDAEVRIEGRFQGDQIEGSYALYRENSTEVSEKGTWKVARSTEKPGK